MDELREAIRKECENAVESQVLPSIDPEFRHVYIEEFYGILERNRFIKPSSLVLSMLAKMGAVSLLKPLGQLWKR